MPLNLYLLKRQDRVGYEEFDSCLVVAADKTSARLMAPHHFKLDGLYYDWTNNPESLSVSLVGTADPSLVEGQVVIASFNAG